MVSEYYHGQKSHAIDRLLSDVATLDFGWEDFFAAMDNCQGLAALRECFKKPHVVKQPPQPQMVITQADSDRYKTILNNNLPALVAAVQGLGNNFIPFLALMPSVDRHPSTINIKAQAKSQPAMAAQSLLLNQVKARELWQEFFQAMEKYPSLNAVRALFTDPQATISAAPPQPAKKVVQMRFEDIARYENQLHNHLSDLCTFLSRFEKFDSFIDAMPSITTHPGAPGIRATASTNPLSAAEQILLHHVVPRELWGELFQAMEKFPELAQARAIFK